MTTSRRKRLADRFAASSVMKSFIGPKLIKPTSDWYQSQVDPDEAARSGETNGQTPPDSSTIDLREAPSNTEALGDHPAAVPASLASARTAEAFFADTDASLESIEVTAASEAEDNADVAATSSVNEVNADARDETPPQEKLSWFAGVKDVTLRVKDRTKAHNLAVVAAGIAFWGLLAIPAVLAATLSIYGLVADEEDVAQQIENNLSALPDDARSIITDQLESVAGAANGGLALGAIISIVLALWTSSGAVAKLITTFNTIWDVEETRKFFQLRGLALMITLGAIGSIATAAFLLAVLPAVLTEAGLADVGRYVINAGRFPALLIVMTVGLAVLYWIGPARKAKFRVVTWGSVIATILWLVTSGLFTVYTSRFDNYNETYGSLGAIVVLLLWLFLTSFMVLLGAEVDAAREKRRSELAQPMQAD